MQSFIETGRKMLGGENFMTAFTFKLLAMLVYAYFCYYFVTPSQNEGKTQLTIKELWQTRIS